MSSREPSGGLVARARLLALMDAGTTSPVTLLCAPAGAGKSTVVYQWAAARGMQGVAWVDNDEAPGSAGTLWERILAALGRSGLDLTGLDTGGADPARHVLGRLTERLRDRGEPVCLVLDCDDEADSEVTGLDRLLGVSDGLVRLVLTARSDPVLPLASYRDEGWLTEIRSTDLAFTVEEATELFRGQGVTLTPDTVSALVERTQGWAAGLRFAAMSLVGHSDPDVVAVQFRGDRGTVAEFLLAEVLGQQSDGARRILLRTSVLDLLRPGLLEEVGGRLAPGLLRSMAESNAFVSAVPDSPGSFRYHALFRDLLRAQLAYESPGEVADLHRQAAAWLREHGPLVEAVRHAASAGDWADACQFIVDDLAVGRLLLEGADGLIGQTVAHLPAETPGAAAALLRATMAMTRFDLDSCAGHAAAARRLLASGHGPRSWPERLGVALVELILARGRGDVAGGLDAAAALEQALLAVEPTRVSVHPELTALLLSSQGALLLAGGWLDEADAVFTAGLSASASAGCELPRYNCLGHLALIQALNGQLRAATATADRAQATIRGTELGVTSRTPALEVALAWVRLEQYDLDAARLHASRAESSAGLPVDPVPRAMLSLVRARLLRADQLPDFARESVRRAGQDLQLAPWLRDRLRSEEAALALADGKVSEAELLLAQVSQPDEPDTTLTRARAQLVDGVRLHADESRAEILATEAPLHIQVAGWLLETSRLLQQQEHRQAEVALANSLRLAAPESMRRMFVEAPPPVRDLLQHSNALVAEHSWMRLRASDPGANHRTSLVALEEPQQQPASPVLVEVLTAKEREVLALLAQLLTTQEIADEMFVSVNTVRTHVRNIMRKLAVSRRNDAVRRAHSLRLLPEQGGRST